MNRDITLLAAAKKIQQDVPTAVFELCAPALYKYVFRLCRSAVVADQIVGDIFTRFLERLSSGGCNRINFRLELYTIAYEILVRDTRYSNYFIPVVSKISQYANPADLDIEDPQLFKNIQHALLYHLTDDQRHVVLLRFVEGFSVKETALIMGKKVGAVKVIQNRGIAALRKALHYEAVENQTMALFIRRMLYA